MKHLTASTSASPFSGENWFDPLEDAIRFRVRAFIEAVVAEEAQAALGGRARYQRSGAPKGYRNGHRHRQLVGTFGALTVSLPRVRLLDGDGGEKEWRSQTIQAYKRLTKRAEAIIANTYLAGTNTRRVRRALAGLFGGKVGKDAVSRAWRKVKTDWESWQARDLSGEDIVRLIHGWQPASRRALMARVLSIPLLVVLGVRRDGQKVLLAVKNMGGETEAACVAMSWRTFSGTYCHGLKAPELGTCRARTLSGDPGWTGVKARLDGRVLSIPLLVVLGVRRDGQKVLLAVKNMGGETEAASSWRRRRQGPGGGAGQPVE